MAAREGNGGRTHREVIEDVCGCGGDCYCVLREIILASGPDDRTLEQMKCVEIYKFEEGINGEDGGWQEAWGRWVSEGHAKRFAEVYNEHHEHLKARGLYNVVMGRDPRVNS